MSMFKIKIKCLPSWDINAGPPLVIRLPSQAPRPYWLTIHILALFLWNFEGVSFWLVWHSLLWQDTKWKSFSRVRLFATSWTAACQASLSITNSWSLLKLKSIKLVMPSNHLILCHPLLFLPSIIPSFRVLSNEPVLHISSPKYWSFRFSIHTSNVYSELISFRIDWFDLLAVQETL